MERFEVAHDFRCTALPGTECACIREVRSIVLFNKAPEGTNLTEFTTKDSGQREQFSTGMVRDVQTDKPRYDLVWKPGLKRVAELMARGAKKYTANNWMKASTEEELDRFKASANRHFEQWMAGDTDEDHMAGTIFNLFGAEYVKERLKGK